VSLFDVAAEWMTVPLVQHEYGAGGPTRVGLHHPTIAPYGAYATSEGAVTLISIQNEREWVRLCEKVLDRANLAADPRFSNNNLRVEHRAEMDVELSAAIGAFSRDEFQRRLGEGSIAYGSVNSLEDLSNHRALRRRDLVSSFGHPVEIPAHPVRDVTTPSDKATPSVVPALGADTERIRREFA